MLTKEYTKHIYNKFGLEYHKHRSNPKENFWNKFIEIPSMNLILRNLVRNKKVVDLGCGSGILTKRLKYWGADVVGVDLSKNLIKIAEKENPNIKFYASDASKTPFKNSEFNIVTSSLMVHYFKNLTEIFNEANRILKVNGYFVFSIQHPVNEVIKEVKIGGVKKFLLMPYFHNNKSKWKCTRHMKVITYHHTFESIFNALNESRFVTEMLLEPLPKKSTRKLDTESYYRTSKSPSFCIFKTRKIGNI